MSKIIHLGRNGIHMNKYVKVLDENFDYEKHFFYLTGKDINNKNNVIDIRNKTDFIKNIIRLNLDLYKSKKIIIHGFSQTYFFYLFFFQPWLLPKVYWIIWGWDLYSFLYKSNKIKFKIIQFMKKRIIPKIGHFVTYIKGDYLLAQKWYGANGQYHECFMYPSNIYKEYNVGTNDYHSTINIQVGNSADSLNNHIEVLEKLTVYKDKNIKIFAPISYGDKEYAKLVIKKGKEFFGNKFIPITELMPFEKYLEFLSKIDIAIFNSNIQIAMGNTITLIGLRKKVYMKNDVTPWKFFNDMGVKVFDVENIELELLEQEIKKMNQQKIREYFSKENYLNQLKNIFESK